jgi:hypothetical protein
MTATLTPEIFARIELYPTSADGRKGPLPDGMYRGVLGVAGEHYSIAFVPPAGVLVQPGDAVEVGVQFLFPELALPHFAVGTEFTLWEGRDIGRGRVLRVL